MVARCWVYIILVHLLLIGNDALGQHTPSIAVPPNSEQLAIEKPFLYQFVNPQYPQSLAAIRKLPVHMWRAVNSVNFGDKGSPGWVKFELQSSIPRTIWLELQSHFIDSVQVWLISMPGSPGETIKAYRPTGFRLLAEDQEAPAQHPFFLKSLQLLPNVRYAVYVRGWVPPGDVLKFNVILWRPSAFWRYQQQLVAGWAVFIGLVLMSVFVTLVSYAFHPRPIYLYYCGYVFFMSGYALLNDGWGAFMPNSLQWFDSTSRAVHWLSGGILFLLLFTRSFLSLNTKSSRGYIRLNPVWLFLLIEVSIFTVDYSIHHNRYDWVIAGYQVGFGALTLYALLWLVYVLDALRRNFRPVWLYIGSVLVWLFFYITNVFLVNTGWVTDPFPDMLVFRLAVVAEVCLIFIGWMYRQRLIRESQQRLQAQEQTRQQKLLEAERKQQAEELKALRLERELQNQREQLARDLHDGIGSQLTHIASRLDILSIRKTDEQAQLQRLSLFTRETNQALRDTVWILNRSEISFSTFSRRLHSYLLGLWEYIESPCLNWHAETVDTSSKDELLPPLLVQSLFRITQEAVNNAIKYANATAIIVSLTYRNETVELAIIDNGVGFDQATATGGYGLANMQKRAEEINGKWSLASSDEGTHIQVCIDIMR